MRGDVIRKCNFLITSYWFFSNLPIICVDAIDTLRKHVDKTQFYRHVDSHEQNSNIE